MKWEQKTAGYKEKVHLIKESISKKVNYMIKIDSSGLKAISLHSFPCRTVIYHF